MVRQDFLGADIQTPYCEALVEALPLVCKQRACATAKRLIHYTAVDAVAEGVTVPDAVDRLERIIKKACSICLEVSAVES